MIGDPAHDELKRRGVVLAMARVKQDLRDQLERIGLITHIGPERLFATLPVALKAFEQRKVETRLPDVAEPPRASPK